MVGNKNNAADDFIRQGLNEEFSPSEQTLKNIKAFSDAYCLKKSDSIGDIESVLN